MRRALTESILTLAPDCVRIVLVSDIAVVIVNYNTRDRLRDCLHSLDANRGVSFIAYVVDNGSPDGSAAMVRTEFPLVHLIECQTNRGFSFANNLALRLILALQPMPRMTLLLNPDTVLPPDALAMMTAFFDAHPDAGLVGPKLVMTNGKLDLACRRSFPSPELAIYHTLGLDARWPHHKRFARYNMTFLDENETAQVDSVVGAFMMMRTEALCQAGLLDESYFMYGEDLDLAWRIKKHGWSVYYYPAVEVLHVKREASRNSARAPFEFWRAAYIFYKKHYAAATPLPVHLGLTAGMALKGGPRLVREMLRPLPPAPNAAEIR